MAHYAQLDENNVVIGVIVVSNADEMEDGQMDEDKGITFCQNLTGHQTWKKTSYNSNIRKNYAGIGYSYDGTRDAFIPPKPFNSWVLNETTCQWESPVPYPADGQFIWDEETTQWVAQQE